MKQLIFTKAKSVAVFFGALMALFAFQKAACQGQVTDKKGKVHVTVVKTVNGQTTVTDTTYDTDNNAGAGEHKEITKKFMINGDDDKGIDDLADVFTSPGLQFSDLNLDSLLATAAGSIKM